MTVSGLDCPQVLVNLQQVDLGVGVEQVPTSTPPKAPHVKALKHTPWLKG